MKLSALLLAAALAAVPSRLLACTCVRLETARGAWERADVVFVGWVKAVRTIDWNWQEYTFQVRRWKKGAGPDTVVVRTGMGDGDCGRTFRQRRRYRVYAYFFNGELMTSACSYPFPSGFTADGAHARPALRPGGRLPRMSRPPAVRLASIQVALPRTHGDEHASAPMDRAWTTAFFKEPVAGPVWLGKTNLAGDAQADRVHHGGPDKAVMAYAAAHYPRWREELGREMPHGAFGENFTVEGLDESTACLGDVYAVGGARVQVSQPRIPCWKIARRWKMRDLSAREQRTGRTGWYLRVLEEGRAAPGDEVALLDRPQSDWTIARANEAMYRVRTAEAIRALAECPALAPSLAAVLRQHAEALLHAEEARLVGPNQD